ncbi:MAG: hypothetical protein Q6366_006680 [Candidatus Freyarchaeota archaeon]
MGYLRRPCGEEGSVVEAGASQDICTSELQKVEELLKFLGARYTRSSGGLSMLEPLEPYVRVDSPVKQLEEMSERLRGDGALGTVERVYEDLERRGVPKSLGFEELGRFLRSGKDVPVDVYLKICRRLGVRVDLGVVARWRSPAVDIATGEWYSRSDVAVRVEPADLRRLYEELLEKLKSEGMSLDRFAAMLADAGAVSARGSDVKEILGRRYVDTVTLSEICAFLGREPSEVRELDQSSMSKWESVLLSRRDIRRIRFEAWKKYGSNYYSELAKDTNTSGVKIKHCLLDGRKIPLEVLGKIEEVLGIKLGGSFHDRVKIRFKDYGREVMRGEGGAEALVEKIEVNDPKEGKREILTFIHRRGKDGSITREVKQTGETFDPSTTLWFFSLPNTRVTVDRTKEFREGKDLLTYIAEKSIEKAGSLSRAEKILNVSSSTLGRWLGDKESNTLTLINLLTLAMYSGAVDRLSELTDYVEKVGAMEKKDRPNLTIEMRGEDAAYVVTSIVFGDGSFRKRGRNYELEYFNKEEENIERMEEKMWNVFGVKPSRGLRKDGFHYLHIYSSLAGISLLGIGLLFGEKTLINQGLPKFIVEGTVQEHKASIEAMVADEGHIEEYSGISVLLTVGASELEECRGALNQIEGVPVRGGVKGEILGKFIATRKLPEEIKTKVEEKETQSS